MKANPTISQARRQQGRAQFFVLVVLLALGAGGWNYSISYRADLESHRDLPFAPYSTPELRLLEEAYADEAELARTLYEQQRGLAEKSTGSGSQEQRLASRIANLERAQAEARKMRSAQTDFAENEARLGEIRAELERRSRPLARLRVHLERLMRKNDI